MDERMRARCAGNLFVTGILLRDPLDASPSSFNEAERAAKAEVWHRVAEEYAAFDIDVTTEEPPSFE